MGYASFQTWLALKKSDGMYKLLYLFFRSITLLAGNRRGTLGTETLYLGVARALLRGGDLDRDRDLLRLSGDLDLLLGDLDLFLDTRGTESFSRSRSRSSFQSL